MKKIKILGTGCTKCNKLADAAKKMAESMELDYELEKVTNMMRFADYGVMVTPAMVVDGEVKVSGKIPSESALKEMLS